MISVEQLIGELLLRHNCVIIPSFGGFVAKQLPASIDYQSGTMFPPKKSLLFNRQLINNDGLLIAECAVRNSLNYTEASEKISTLVDSWNEQLKAGSRISIDKVGFLFLDQERNVCFEQDRFFNLLLASYGLEKIHFMTESDVQIAQKIVVEKSIEPTEKPKLAPIISFSIEKDEPKETTETKIVELPQLKKNVKVWRYVAAACLVPIAFYSFWIPMKTDVLESGVLSVKDFNPFYHSKEGKYSQKTFPKAPVKEEFSTLEETVSKLPEDVKVFSYEYDADLFIPVKISREESQKVNKIEEDYVAEFKSTQSKFEYIVGCFGSEQNANNLVASLKAKGIQAYIFDEQNGLKRISAGSAVNQNDLNQLISLANSNGFQGWVLKK